MLLYQHAHGHYLAVTPAMRFKQAAGYILCFDGRNVPELICRAFVDEHGGQIIGEQDIIELSDDRRQRPATRRQAAH